MVSLWNAKKLGIGNLVQVGLEVLRKDYRKMANNFPVLVGII